MWVNMLCLREKGERLTAADLDGRRPLVGRLTVNVGHERWDTRRGQRLRSALLCDPAASLALAELHRVVLVKIGPRGMVLSGLEEVWGNRAKDRQVYRQAWWCWPAGVESGASNEVLEDALEAAA